MGLFSSERGMSIGTACVTLLVYGSEGGAMNRIENKGMIADAATLFAEEVRELMPDISRKELCDMVDDYIYYQADDVTKEEAHAAVNGVCK
jgi:hypothetical protein